jgi:polyribonucleotide nucleotidyltransferase
MQSISVQRQIGAGTLTIETGSWAKLADGSVTVQYGNTVAFAAVVRAEPREGIDFFPLQVDYRERRAAAGKFPGGFLKREGRPSTKEILAARLVDRPLRPLFPKGFLDEVQIHLNVLASDQQHDPDVLAGIGASAAVAISDIPMTHPTAHVRVGRVNGELVLFPTQKQLEESDLDLVVAGTKHYVNMIEVGAREIPEDAVAAAIEFGHKAVIEIVGMIEELVARAGKPKVGEVVQPDAALVEAVRNRIAEPIRQIKGKPGKADRADAIEKLMNDTLAELAPTPTDPAAPYSAFMAARQKQAQVRQLFVEVEEAVTRQAILAGVRPDGRSYTDIRPISCEVGVLPRVHGSAVFSRGETQSLCTVALGTADDEQMVDGLVEEYSQKFYLHYNFPSYSVGEVRPIRGPGRREIGHGALAERSLLAVLPTVDLFPYTVRVISDILESNGSSSMASSCGGCLALMDAGVPITRPVAGISIGLVQEADRHVLLTDIIGEEDHFGDMDFKVCGTREGVTAIQLDIKIEGLSYDVIRQTLGRAKEARLQILDAMARTLDKPRPEISPYAPKMIHIQIDPELIGKVIGPSGKTIKKIQEDTGAKIDIEDDGTVYISAVEMASVEKAKAIVEAMTATIKLGSIYTGKVVSIREFGAFVEIAPETDGLLHVSEISDRYVERVEDELKLGDEVKVKVINIDDTGRIKLSRKAALRDEGISEADQAPPQEPGDDAGNREGGYEQPRHERHGDRGHRGGGHGGHRGDRGGRGGERGGRGGHRGGGGGGHGGHRGGGGGGGGHFRGG